MSTQKENIKAHLVAGNKITPIIAMTDFGCMRLAAVIFTLREDGMDISTNNITRNGKTFAQYSLVVSKPEKELLLVPRSPSGNGYADNTNKVHLCGVMTRDLISSPEDTSSDVVILLSTNDNLEHEIACAAGSGICKYLTIDGKEIQVLSGAYDYVEEYLGDKTGSMTISYK